jgi:hypothetical protein
MAAPSRRSPRELRAWRDRWGLRNPELAWLLGIPLGTLKHKLTDPRRLRLDTDRKLDDAEMLLHLGIRPSGWPPRLIGRIHNNNIG